MSLVERALKKLHETRASATVGEPSESRTSAASVQYSSAAKSAGPPTVPILELAPKVDVPTRKVVIDRNALRAMQLLPPVNLERQIGSQYQQVKRPLITSALGKGPKGQAIMLASALSGEGKTFTSINLALSMALEKDTEVLLIDADVAKPHLTKIFGLQGERGLLDLLTDSTLRPESVILPTDIPGLSLMPAGKQTETATELIASERMMKIVEQLGAADSRRISVFDSPPLLLSTESRALVPSVGHVVLVVRAEATPRRAVQDALDMIGDDKPVSLILNQTSVPASEGYYGYGTYGDQNSDTPKKS
jgi:exopolysaccharide/PEP-CTERM locus tyrosine autokinase